MCSTMSAFGRLFFVATLIGLGTSSPHGPSFISTTPRRGFALATPPWLGSRDSQRCEVPFGRLSKRRCDNEDSFGSDEFRRAYGTTGRDDDGIGAIHFDFSPQGMLDQPPLSQEGNTCSQREGPEEVHVVLFNPETEEEGVHTVEFPKGSGNKVVLAFESHAACEKFSDMLRQQNFVSVPQTMKFDFLQDYCISHGVFVEVVPNDMDIQTPKADDVSNLDVSPVIREQRETLDRLFLMDSGVRHRARESGGVIGCDEDDWTATGCDLWQ